jgi:nucleolar protein TMA23
MSRESEFITCRARERGARLKASSARSQGGQVEVAEKQSPTLLFSTVHPCKQANNQAYLFRTPEALTITPGRQSSNSTMDAAGLLKKQGWRGLGHSLDSDNKGLRKPLLVSKKIDVLGIGINKADVIQGQWWLKAFDSSLKDFGTGKKSILANVKEQGIKRGGLYGRFVQGEGVAGTIGVVDPKVAALASAVGPAVGVKRKAEDDEDEDKVEKKKAKKDKKEKKRSKSTSDSSSDDEKKARRAAKKAKKSATTDEDTSDAATTTKKSKSKKDKSLDGLPEDKRKQYEERAAAKGVTLDQYFSLRLAKNLEAKEARRSGTTTPATESASEDSAKDDKKKEKKIKKDKKSSKK